MPTRDGRLTSSAPQHHCGTDQFDGGPRDTCQGTLDPCQKARGTTYPAVLPLRFPQSGAVRIFLPHPIGQSPHSCRPAQCPAPDVVRQAVSLNLHLVAKEAEELSTPAWLTGNVNNTGRASRDFGVRYANIFLVQIFLMWSCRSESCANRHPHHSVETPTSDGTNLIFVSPHICHGGSAKLVYRMVMYLFALV